ncbi:hypothetical protein Q31a_17920 [Aureliella helgolandensis]|uniref:Uncharacterized protein n=1 Tax=Aureliella helgolandensis TaxID=2527968 RepID=A0A518G4G3_9BACT|nr:hypothetical protein Q31a_17920 [Aureliella helgolandensis]
MHPSTQDTIFSLISILGQKDRPDLAMFSVLGTFTFRCLLTEPNGVPSLGATSSFQHCSVQLTGDAEAATKGGSEEELFRQTQIKLSIKS